MKKTLLLLLSASLIIGCSKDSNESSGLLIGKWKKIAAYTDPGDGSGEFIPVESNQIIEFHADSTFTSNEPICLDGSGLTSETGTFTTKLLLLDGCSEYNLRYQQEGLYLVITHQCYEGCFEKYARINLTF